MKDRLAELKQQNENGDVIIQINNTPGQDNNNGGKLEYTESKNETLREIFERTKVINQLLDSIEKNTQDVNKYVTRIGDIKSKQKDVQDKIQSLFKDSTTTAEKVNKKLNELEQEMKNVRHETAEGRIKTIQYNSLKIRYKNVLSDHYKELANYQTVQKQILQAQLNAKGKVQVNEEELDLLLNQDKDFHVFTENILAETTEARKMLIDLEDRHQHLLKIERMITEVRDLFVQMSILIESQQDLIDRVEYQAQTASEYIAAVDLNSVRKAKKKYLKRKICISITIIIVILILLIMLFK